MLNGIIHPSNTGLAGGASPALRKISDGSCPEGDAYYPLEGKLAKSRDRKEDAMNIESKTVLITGSNRGIGRALFDESLRRGRREFMRERAAHWKTATKSPLDAGLNRRFADVVAEEPVMK